MSSATRRGLWLFGGLVVVIAVFCYWLPFVALPGARLGVGLPSISLPAEALTGNFLGLGFPLLNSITSLIVVDIILLAMGFVVNRAVSGQLPNRFIPRGFTNFMEVLVDFWYNQARSVLGEHTARVLPLALTVFVFLLTANWLERIPGFDSVGIISCAEVSKAGYPLQANGVFLDVSGKSLKDRAGTKVSEADLAACEAQHPQFIAPGAKAAATTTTAADASKGNPNLFNVIPYFRGLATDLNMPLALAIIVFIAVQVWGIQSLGIPYFFKFINIPALGNLSKNPIGVMDFVVGIVDIISELSRLISLSFRLLGNIFAGGVLLAVMSFLVAGVLPAAFVGLEFFVGVIQAYVFATLTIMYASQAVFAHGGEEHEEHEEHVPAQAATTPGR